MATLYIASSDAYSGKTLTCLVLGTRWQRQGRRVGFLKPLGLLPVTVGDEVTDEDALFVAGHLQLETSPGNLCPVMLTPGLCHADAADLRRRVKEAFAATAEGCDVMLVSGLGSVLSRGSTLGLDGPAVAELLDAQVLLVARGDSFLAVDAVVAAHRALGDRLLGVILNRVPARQREVIERDVVPCLKDHQIPVLGLLPEDPLLSSVSVREIAEATGGEIIAGEASADDLVENFVLGAMQVDSALRYFRQSPRKCVITGGDRTDIQFAALETSSRCLVLTGRLRPSHRVIARAQELNVPVLLVNGDTLTTVTTIEHLLGKQRVREKKKVDHALAQFEALLDLKRLDASLGLGSRTRRRTSRR